MKKCLLKLAVMISSTFWLWTEVVLGQSFPEAPTLILEEHTRPVLSLDFSPNGQMLASGSGDGVLLWDVRGQKEVGRLLAIGFDVAFSPDGQILASTSLHGARLWDIQSQKEIATFGKRDIPIPSNHREDG